MRNLKLLCLVLLSLITVSITRAETINVSVAISMKEAVTEIAKAYEEKSGDKVELAFGSSGQLLGQIKSGLNVDVFISAADKQIDDLAKEGLMLEGTRCVLASNALVLVVPRDSKLSIKEWKDLADPAVKRISLGEPKTVPAGQYATQALKSLQLADVLKDRIAYGANVRQVLTYVEMGEVDAGLVYLTDAKESGDKVKVVKTAEATTHEPIVYPGVVVKTTKKPAEAKRFLEFFSDEKAKAILTGKGFTLPQSGTPTGTLKIEGEVEKPVSISAADLLKMPRKTVNAPDKDGSQHSYEGVAVSDLLDLATVKVDGNGLRGKALTKCLVVEAGDGYRVVFALPELSKDFTDKEIILADRRDGQALSAFSGPLQIIVPSEKLHARWIRQVVSFKIVTL